MVKSPIGFLADGRWHTGRVGVPQGEKFNHVRGSEVLNFKQVRFGLFERFIVLGESQMHQDNALCSQYFLDLSNEIKKLRHCGRQPNTRVIALFYPGAWVASL